MLKTILYASLLIILMAVSAPGLPDNQQRNSGKRKQATLLLNLQLFDAVKQGKLKDIEKLITAGADVNARDLIGRTPMMVTNSPEKIELLLAACADIYLKD